MVSTGMSNISSFGPSRVSRMIFSFARSARLYCTLHFCNGWECWVLVCLKMHLSPAVCVCLLTEPGCTLVEFGGHLQCEFVYNFRNSYSRGEIQPNLFYANLRIELIMKERERERLEFELQNENYELKCL